MLRYIAYLDLGQELIFEVAAFLRKEYSLERELTQFVVEETEKYVSWMYAYTKPKEVTIDFVGDHSRIEVLKKLFTFIPAKDSLELLYVSKRSHHIFKKAFISNILLTKELEHEARQFLWMQYVPKVLICPI